MCAHTWMWDRRGIGLLLDIQRTSLRSCIKTNGKDQKVLGTQGKENEKLIEPKQMDNFIEY